MLQLPPGHVDSFTHEGEQGGQEHARATHPPAQEKQTKRRHTPPPSALAAPAKKSAPTPSDMPAGEQIVPSAPGSVHSKGSGTSGTSSITQIVRKGVLAKSGKLESSLLTLRWAVLFTFALTAALNLAALLVTLNLAQQLDQNLTLVRKNGRRSELAQRLYSIVQTWRAAAIGLADPVDMAYERAKYDVCLKEYTALNRELYLAVDGSLPEEKDLYTNASAVIVKDFESGSMNAAAFTDYSYTLRGSNLANAASELATRMRAVLAMNASSMLFVEPTGNVFWLTANGPDSLQRAFNRSLMLADERSSTHGVLIKQADFIILIVSELLFFLVIVLAIVPSVLSVSRAKHAVFDTFISVPLPVIQALRATVAKRIQELAAAENDGDAAIEVAGQIEDEAVDIKAALRASREHEGDTTADNLLAAVNASANVGLASPSTSKAAGTRLVPSGKARKKHKREYKRTNSTTYFTLATFIWPVVAYMGYFAVMWWWKSSVVDVAGGNREQLLWSTQVEVYIRLASLKLRFAYQFCGAEYTTQMLSQALDSLHFTEHLVNELLYGNPKKNLPAGLQEGHSDYNDLWLANACMEDQEWYYPID